MLLRLGVTLTLILSGLSATIAQDSTGNLDTYLQEAIDGSPGAGEGGFQKPTADQLNIWEKSFQALVSDSLATARSLAGKVKYQVTSFMDTALPSGSQIYYILEPQQASQNHWGYYAINPRACRDALILQCPHPQFDFNTGDQGTYCFKRTSARALFVSGTHRCNRDTYSLCSGTTTVCSDTSEPYRIADPAHTTGTPFQRATAVLREQDQANTFVQLHGFAKRPSDPYVILSNGTRETPPDDPAAALKAGLLAADSVLTFKTGHRDTGWQRLLGFNNVQGRLINGSPDPCRQNATGTKGRFLHIEQELEQLRRDRTKWSRMTTALKQAFPCNSTEQDQANPEPSVQLQPNPASSIVEIKAQALKQISLYEPGGRLVRIERFPDPSKAKLMVEALQPGLYLMKVQQLNTISYHRLLIQ